MSFLESWWNPSNAAENPLGYEMNHTSASPGLGAAGGMSEAEWNYYQQNIQPIQASLLRSSTDPNTLTQNVNTAQADVNTQFKNLPGAFQRQMAGSGTVTTPAQQANFAKQSALNKGIATAGASNMAVKATGLQQRQAIGY